MRASMYAGYFHMSSLSNCWDGRPFGLNRHGPFPWGAVSPSNTVSLGPRPTSVPSGILIHPTVWPQYTKVTDRQDNGRVA